jgi:hypothetical protein
MARPRRSDDERRSECLTIRLTPAERLALLAEAEQLSITPTSLARQRLIRGRLVVHEHRRLDPRQVFELGRIGVNLNQIARALNSGQHLNPATIEGVLAELKRLIGEILRPEADIPHSGDCDPPNNAAAESANPAPRRPERPPHVNPTRRTPDGA